MTKAESEMHAARKTALFKRGMRGVYQHCGKYALDIGGRLSDLVSDRPALAHREVRHG